MSKRLSIMMVGLLAFAALVAGARTLAQSQFAPAASASCGKEPLVGVESVQIVDASCGTENTCVKVKWNAKPNGAVITGFKVDLAATPTAPPTTPQTRSVDVNGNAREAILGIFTSSLQGGPFKADVTAKYQGCTLSSKSGSF